MQNTVPDEKDDFSDFRKNVVELVRDVVFLVGSLECFTEVRLARVLTTTMVRLSVGCIMLSLSLSLMYSSTPPSVSLALPGTTPRPVSLSCMQSPLPLDCEPLQSACWDLVNPSPLLSSPPLSLLSSPQR